MRWAAILLAVASLLPLPGWGQAGWGQAPSAPSVPAAPAPASSAAGGAAGVIARCPSPAQTGQAELLGLWHAVFEGQARGATLLLEQHPELAESVRGAINRDGERALVAGDVDAGDFTLEESVDGKRISATWLGTVVLGSCGREIRGDWQGGGDAAPIPFHLRKLP